MNITLSNGERIRGDLIVSSVVRTDLVPVPVTLECTVRWDAKLEPFLREGQIVRAGLDEPELRIIWASPDKGTLGMEQGSRPLGTISFVALLDACADIAFRRSKAVIKEGSTLGAIYRACGAKVTIESDFTVKRFSCFVGGVPSYQIAQALQEEAGALVWQHSAKKLKFVRLPDLLKSKPVESLGADSIERVKSGFLERHEVPWFYSTDQSGTVIFGNRQKTRVAKFTPLKNSLTLNNMTRALVHAGTFTGRLDMQINAGDVFDVGGTPLVVVTAVHAFESGTDGKGQEQYSRFWLHSLES